jgi:tetratricopeptide (TPR) repeat protein
MPSTYNGIGTSYHGKKNIQKRPGPCPHCNRATELTSYDTRLWFVIFFIPIFPLGRKRIIDYCPACTRHYAVDAQKWETARQLEISGAQDEYRANATPENAIALHQQLLKYHEVAEATELQKKMSEQYAASAKVQAYLGAALEHVGRRDEATPFFAKALELRPDLPEARIGMARSHMRAGKLEDARALLDFLEKPGAAHLYSLQPLETLAIAYQNANRHAEALELFSRLQSELPNIAEIKGFRDMVKKSEKALAKGQSMLPEQKFSWKRFFSGNRGARDLATPRVTWRSLIILGVFAGLVALGLVISNEYIRHHRKVYLVNAFAQPARIEIQGQGSPIAVRHVANIELPEGHYHATISGPLKEQIDFDVRSSYFSRWGGDPIWLVNVGGAAVLAEEGVTYAQNPPPGSLSLHYGKPFEFFPSVTHPFLDLPDSLRMKSGESRTLVRVDFFNQSGNSAFQYELHEGHATDAPTLAECWLRTHPADKVLLRSYTDYLNQKQPDRLDRFLRAGLTNRPVEIEWHRAYQRLHQKPADYSRLIVDYDQMLAADPTNSALLYLSGRICPDRQKARLLFERAIESDPKNPFPNYAIGYDRVAAGDWQAARPPLARAAELAPDDPYFIQYFHLVRLALGETVAVEKEEREAVRKKQMDYPAELRLIQTLVAEGNRDAVMKEISDCERRWGSPRGHRGQDPSLLIKCYALYGLGDFTGLEKTLAHDQTPTGRLQLAWSLIEQNRLDEALKLLPAEDDADEKPWHCLALSIACASAGKTDAAGDWLNRSLKAMANSNEDVVHAAGFLSRNTPPTDTEIDNIVLPPRAKAMLLAALAQKYPPAASRLWAQARKFNIDRSFPYHLLNRITAPNQAGVP